MRKRAEAMLAIATAAMAVSGTLVMLELFTNAFAEALRSMVADLERERRGARSPERMLIGVPDFADLPPGVTRS